MCLVAEAERKEEVCMQVLLVIAVLVVVFCALRGCGC